MSELFCGACGNPRSGSAAFCGRCGFAFDASLVATAGAPDVAATTNRASLRKTVVGPDDETIAGPLPVSVVAAAPTASTPAPSPPPPPPLTGGWPPPEPAVGYPPPPPRGAAPPVLWLVTVGMIVLAGVVVYPIAQFTPDLIGSAFSSDGLGRAFATLLLQFVVMFWAAGFALVALAVGLVRGSRVAQILTAVLAGITAVAYLISLSTSDGYGVRPDDGVLAVIVLVSLGVIALVTVPPSVRRFFAADPRPVGVSLAATANVYLGAVALVDAALICLAGVAGMEYVWIGLAFAVVGALLVVTSRGLREGSGVARGVTLVVYVGLAVAVVWFGVQRDQLGDLPSLLPLGIVLAGAIGLIGPQSSRQHFAGPAVSLPLRAPSVIATAVALVLVAATAVFGFHAASDISTASESPYQLSADGNRVSSTGPSEYDARQTAVALLDSLEGNGSDPSCAGTQPVNLSVTDYQIGDVTEATNGSFDVSADVTLDDGRILRVTYSVVDDSAGSTCVDGNTFSSEEVAASQPQPSAIPTPATDRVTEPGDVPAVVSADDPVPTDATLPAAPAGTVVPYTDSSTVPTDESEIVEYQPSDLDADQADAVRSVIAFMTHVNRQDFQPAWDTSTERLISSDYDSSFSHGYRTTHFMQVAFGQPEQLNSDLMIVPGRFVSRQDPDAQGNPDGVTDCTYWPQYMFLVARVDGQWLLDVARKYQDRSAIKPYKRQSETGKQLNPIQQRVSC